MEFARLHRLYAKYTQSTRHYTHAPHSNAAAKRIALKKMILSLKRFQMLKKTLKNRFGMTNQQVFDAMSAVNLPIPVPGTPNR